MLNGGMQTQNTTNKKGMKGWIIALVIVILLVAYGASAYNGFVSEREAVDTQWSQVENQYQRRFDLIPNLVATVKGAFGQEQAVFGEIAEARTHYSGATTVNEKVAAANETESALGRLLVVMEQYPQLMSMQAVQNLMTQLEGTENRVSVERMRYNDAVKVYQTHMKSFPGNVIAGLFHFESREYFNAAEAASTTPAVSF